MRQTSADHHDYVAGDGRMKARCVLTNITDFNKMEGARRTTFIDSHAPSGASPIVAEKARPPGGKPQDASEGPASFGG